ncbi:MAG: molecular chaperone GrpE [Candidatus Berkelbacteria bacterium Licking1014_85]|uniref:Protein GrpE n=1 Tax=Candidatus Berkelbacteria bacterium Licking1014_85 TaxID=2017148 RepID=A0A554LH87_9BACT|nr:MAG: molecular chaperone GrpE [Candidatus Berkelbacteria bacterium Licking1014_85]
MKKKKNIQHSEENKISELTDQLLRKQAEIENICKRFESEKISIFKYANENLILDLLPVLDNFKRSTDHLPKDLAENNWAKGIKLIEKQLEDVLTQNGLERIDAKIGDEFDHNIHEAIENLPADRQGEGDKISEIVLDGYKLNEKIIRPTKIKVGK